MSEIEMETIDEEDMVDEWELKEDQRENRAKLLGAIECAAELMVLFGKDRMCLPHMFIGDDEFSKVTITIEKPEEGN